MLHQGDLHKKFKENNLANVNFLKLLTKKNSLECFHQLTAFQQRRGIHRNFVKKSTCKQSGLFDHQNFVEKGKQKHRGYFDERNYIGKSTWKQGGFFDYQNYIKKSTWKRRGFFHHRNYIEKSTWKQYGFVDKKNYIEKVRGNDVEIRRNLVFDISTYYPRRIDVDST